MNKKLKFVVLILLIIILLPIAILVVAGCINAVVMGWPEFMRGFWEGWEQSGRAATVWVVQAGLLGLVGGLVALLVRLRVNHP